MNIDKSWGTLFSKVGKKEWFACLGRLCDSCRKKWHLDFAKHLKDKGWLDLEKIDIENWFGNIQFVFEFKFLMKKGVGNYFYLLLLKKEINVSLILSNNLKILRNFNIITRP